MLRYIVIIFLLFVQISAAQKRTIENGVTTYHLYTNNKLTCKEKFTITIHNKEGLFRMMEYYDDFSKIEEFTATVFDQNGKKVRQYKKTDAFDASTDFFDPRQVTDTRLALIEPEYGLFPYTVEYEVEKTTKGFLGIAPWMPRSGFDVDVKSSRLEFFVDPSIELRVKEENGIKGTKTNITDKSGNWIKYDWSVSDLDAVDADDVTYKEFYKNEQRVRIAPVEFSYDNKLGSYNSWAAFGDWYDQLNQGRDELTQETKDFVQSHKDLPKRELAKLLYNYMQDRTRYVSIQLGIGGFQTLPAMKVDSDGFGDCKALTNYMKAMMKHAGVDAHNVVVRAGENAMDVDTSFICSQFNHVFLGIPDGQDTIYLECTSQKQPFGYLGTFTDERYVLWVASNGGSKIIKTPIYGESTNSIKSDYHVNINNAGYAEIEKTETRKGKYFSDYFYLCHLNQTERNQYSYRQFKYNDFTVKEFVYKEPHRDSIEFELDYKLEVNNFSKKIGEKLMVPIRAGNPINTYLTYMRDKNYAEVGRSFTVDETIVFEFDDGYYLANRLEDEEVESEFGKVSVKIEYEEDRAIVHRKIVFYRNDYTGERFDEFEAFYKKANRLDSKKFILNSKT